MNDVSTSSKKPKFKNKMAVVEPRQDLLIRRYPGDQVTLSWTIKNTSKNRPWPIQAEVKNFSKDPLISENPEAPENTHLLHPIKIDAILGPGEDYVFSTKFTVPTNSLFKNTKKFCTLNLFLTNPARNNDKFGDGLITIIEIL
jgi:hypothetical protein